jgi:hypothetical protein
MENAHLQYQCGDGVLVAQSVNLSNGVISTGCVRRYQWRPYNSFWFDYVPNDVVPCPALGFPSGNIPSDTATVGHILGNSAEDT